MTREALLGASVKEFEDRKNNAWFIPCRRIGTKSGYEYLLKQEDKKRKISCAIHFNRSFESSEVIGKFENNEVSINTREELGFDGIVEYKDFVIGIVSQGNYNETMKQYHYRCVGGFTPITRKFLVTSEEEIEEDLGVNSYEVILTSWGKDYPIFPAHLNAGSKVKYITVEVENEDALNPVRDLEGRTTLHQIDRVSLHFVNFTKTECLRHLDYIQSLSKKPNSNFGFVDTFKLSSATVYQISFDWKSLAYKAECRINYYLSSSDIIEVNKIKEVILDNLKAV